MSRRLGDHNGPSKKPEDEASEETQPEVELPLRNQKLNFLWMWIITDLRMPSKYDEGHGISDTRPSRLKQEQLLRLMTYDL